VVRPREQVRREVQRGQTPLDVVQPENHRPLGGLLLQQASQQIVAFLRAAEPDAAGALLALARGGREQLDHAGGLVRILDAQVRKFGFAAVQGLAAGEPQAAQVAAQHGSDAVRGAGRGAMDRAQDGRRARLMGPHAQPLGQAALAVTRGAAQHDAARLAVGVDLPERGPQRVTLLGAAHERDRPDAVEPQAHVQQAHGVRGALAASPVHGHGRPSLGQRHRGEVQIPQAGQVVEDLGRGGDGRGRGEGHGAVLDRIAGGVRGAIGLGQGHLPQDRRRVRRAHEAPVVVLLQEAAQPRLEVAGHREARRQQRRRQRQVRGQDASHGPAAVGRQPGGQLPGHAADGVQIRPGAVVAPAALDLLGRHVRGRAHHRPLGASALVGLLHVERVGHTEIREFDIPRTPAPEHVLGLQVAVDDPVRVGMTQRVEQREQHRAQHGPVQRDIPPPQRPALDQLHDQVGEPGLETPPAEAIGLVGDRAEVEDLHDARVVQPGDGADPRFETPARTGRRAWSGRSWPSRPR
jgi:hypothetical protein